jgi:ABC-type glutathione transport system ATPase component
MSKIKIKNFGPIQEGYNENNGWIDISKVTVFIGNQGSGKSTVAKLISTFKSYASIQSLLSILNGKYSLAMKSRPLATKTSCSIPCLNLSNALNSFCQAGFSLNQSYLDISLIKKPLSVN